jgi:hypothetical protein
MNKRAQWILVSAVYVAGCLGAVACGTTGGTATLAEAVSEEAATSVDHSPAGNLKVERPIPSKPLDWMKKPPCSPDMDELEIRGACYQATSRKPPCGLLFRHGDKCYRSLKPDAPASKEPSSIK